MVKTRKVYRLVALALCALVFLSACKASKSWGLENANAKDGMSEGGE